LREVSTGGVMGGPDPGPPHRFRETRSCHLSYEFGALASALALLHCPQSRDISRFDGLVAQLDRALDYESRGRGFESSRVRQFILIHKHLIQEQDCLSSWRSSPSTSPVSARNSREVCGRYSASGPVAEHHAAAVQVTIAQVRSATLIPRPEDEMSKSFIGLLAFTASAAAAAHAETIAFESDQDILVIRGRQSTNTAIFELVGTSDGQIRCLALDAEDQPVASAISWAEHGDVRFRDLDVGEVERVVCQYQ
jgi:hypothetical protein